MKCTLIAFALLMARLSYAQDLPDYRITVSTNFRLPLRAPISMFPFIRFKKDIEKKVLLGGVGIGVSRFIPINSQFNVKTMVNFSRQVFWNETSQFNKGPNPQDNLGRANSVTTEYHYEVGGILHYVPRKRFSVGLGLGFQVLLVSTRRFQANGISGGGSRYKTRNREYKPVMPVVPLEISWKGDKMLYNIRGEAGLLNRYKKDLTEFGPNLFGLICFEIGMKIE